MHRRTPCIGICSTTYGDLVCRGCKRFAHEIVGWNGYSLAQQKQIENRLRDLRRGASLVWVQIEHIERTEAAASRMDVSLDRQDPEAGLWELMRRSVRHQIGLADLGLKLNPERTAQQKDDPDLAPTNQAGVLEADLKTLVTLIDREFYLRSTAYYEHSYRVSVQ